jgi:hypothetical protein
MCSTSGMAHNDTLQKTDTTYLITGVSSVRMTPLTILFTCHCHTLYTRVWHWERTACDRRQFPGKPGDRVAEAIAETCHWKQRLHTLAGAVEAINENPRQE